MSTRSMELGQAELSDDLLAADNRSGSINGYGSVPTSKEKQVVSFGSMLYLLLWKNTKFVGYKLFIKILCPLILIIIVGSASLASNTYNINCVDQNDKNCPDTYYQHSVPINPNISSTNMPFVIGGWLGSQLCNNNPFTVPGYLGFIPHPSISNNASLYYQLIDHMSQNIHISFETDSICNNILNSLDFTENSLIKFFNSSNQFDNYINNDNYSSIINDRTEQISLLITINDMNEFDYTISINDSIDTTVIINQFEEDVSVLFNNGASQYINHGFLQYQIWIEQSIITLISNDNNIILNNSYPYDYLWNYFIYPSTKADRNAFWQNFQPQFPTVILFMFMFNIADMIGNLVTEKTDGTREALKIMGATRIGYWLSWFIWHFMEYSIIALGISIFGKFIGVIWSNSNLFIIFLWIWSFALSQMALFSWVTTMINSVKLGGFIGGFGFWLLNFVFLYVGDLAGYSAKRWLSIIPNAAFMNGVSYVAILEEKQIGYNWNNINTSVDNDEITMAFIIGMQFIDTIIFIIFTLYFDNIIPTPYGAKKQWYFCFKWCCTNKKKDIHIQSNKAEMDRNIYLKPVYGKNYEKMDDFVAYASIRGIVKEFKGDRQIIRACDDINLDLIRGQVFCLLGHNGAGKTTLISILTGLLHATEGNAWINGFDLTDDMDRIRKYIGLCPQKDVLWPTMTARNHLWLFAKLKGVPAQNVENEIEKTVLQCGIREAGIENKKPEKMSGGEKRKLCLAIALIGGSEIVFLDEPTSGMDPQNRRLVWDLIEREKKERCIILTTHYMEEADTLGDRIAIMAHGKVRCCGSSLYLKKVYDVGYTFTVTVEADNNSFNVRELIDKYIINNIKNSKLISCVGNEIKYQLPFEETDKFAQLFETLDNKKDELGIGSYGISMTTLEEVFCKIGENEHAEYEDVALNVEEKEPEQLFEQPTFQLTKRSEISIFFMHVYAILYKMIHWQKRDWNTIFWRVFYPPFVCALTIIIMYYSFPTPKNDYPLLNLNTNMYNNDMIIPIANYSGISLNNNSNYYNDPIWINTYNNYLSLNGELKFGNSEPINQTFITKEFQSFLYKYKDIAITYGSFFIDPTNINNNIYIGINVSSPHSLPIMLNLYNNWILNSLYTDNNNKFMKLSNKPMKKTDIQMSNEEEIGDQVLGLTLVFLLMFAFIFIPGNAMFWIVNEKKLNTKQQQFISGISVYAYYIGTYIGDLILSIPTLILIFILILTLPGANAIRGDAFIPTFISILFFVISSIPFIYCSSFLFKTNTTIAQTLSSFFLLLGFIPLIIEFILQTTNGFDYSLPDGIKMLCRLIFGSYCVSENLMAYQIKENFYNELFDNYYSWNASVRNWLIMFCQGIVYFCILFLIEYLSSIYSISVKLGFTINEQDPILDDEMIDDDVENEMNRLKNIKDDEKTNDFILLKGLRKVYKGKPNNNIAVKDMWFGVAKSEIFGFLGTNGAGKTSTLSMLTGERFPSSGQAFINGISIYNQNITRRFIGYTPQQDALFDKLTGIEHLKFYALLKGLNGNELNKQINILLNALSLQEYKNKLSETYSGGTKRKLSVAMSMIGNPPIIFLDEPSTGMDPLSRRNMWLFITKTMKGRCIILTTHSMEECEALANKIGIMVNGKLKCLGTTQTLKTKFGKGFQITIIIKNNNNNINEEEQKYNNDNHHDKNKIFIQINEYLNKYFKSEIIEAHNLNLTIRLMRKEEEETNNNNNNICQLKLSKIFEIMQQMKNKLPIQSYGVSQPTLEQIFLMMAKGNQNDDDENKSHHNSLQNKME